MAQLTQTLEDSQHCSALASCAKSALAFAATAQAPLLDAGTPPGKPFCRVFEVTTLCDYTKERPVPIVYNVFV